MVYAPRERELEKERERETEKQMVLLLATVIHVRQFPAALGQSKDLQQFCPTGQSQLNPSGNCWRLVTQQKRSLQTRAE